MTDNSKRIEELKKMFDLGVLSKEEFDLLIKDPSKQLPKTEKNKRKYLIFSSSILIFLIGMYLLFKPNLKEEALGLSKKYVSSQLQNNLAYINKLMDVQNKLNNRGFAFASDVDSVLSDLALHFSNADFDNALIKATSVYESDEQLALVKWVRNSESGKEFWNEFERNNDNNIELKQSNKKLEKLLIEINRLKMEFQVGTPQELKELKESQFSKLSELFSMWDEEYFEPYDYFSYRVNQFMFRSNITPTDIKLYVDSHPELSNATIHPILETLELTEKTNTSEIWEFSTEYSFYNEFSENYTLSNKWYRVSLNENGKINSLVEYKVENKKEISADEYNGMSINSGGM